MPSGDRTGPTGVGPRTGRAAGYCGGFGMPGYANPASWRGFGMGFRWGRGGGFGGGRGWRNMFHATGLPGWMRFGRWAAPPPMTDPEMEKEALRSQADALRAQLSDIEKRLGESTETTE